MHADIRDQDAVVTHLAGHDAVVHFAAESHVDRSIKDPYAFVSTNCHGTNVLCDVAREVGVERFLHISTDEVYGERSPRVVLRDRRLTPRSPYSAAKAGSDLIALSYRTTYGLPVVVTRSSNQFGPYQFPEKVIPLFVTNLLDGAKVPLYGDGRTSATGCSWTTTAGGRPRAAAGADRGDLQRRRPQRAGQPRADPQAAGAVRSRRELHRARRRPPRPRPRYSVTTGKIEALGWRNAARSRRGARSDRRSGIAPTGVVGAAEGRDAAS